MKHAVIVAHPESQSLTCAAAHAYATAARSFGHEVVLRDLYRMHFDPCLRAGEIPKASGYACGHDVGVERALLDSVDVFSFVYPFWFNAPPAMLKGYVERVFSMDFGYGSTAGGTEPLLDGKKLISFSFSGAPEQWVRDTGALAALMTVFDRHVAAMCGLQVLDHVHTGGIVPDMTSEAVTNVLANIRGVVTANFGPGQLRSAFDLVDAGVASRPA
jgi:NAD(P)H dehydrogenase (quinone)